MTQSVDIQWCLAKNNYQQRVCSHLVEKWRLCCDNARAQEAQAKGAAAAAAATAAVAPSSKQ